LPNPSLITEPAKTADMIFLSEWVLSSCGKVRSRGEKNKKLEDLGEILLKKIDRPEPLYGGDRPVSCIHHGGVWRSPGERTILKIITFMRKSKKGHFKAGELV
jgi:hypothetical protein